MSRRDDGVYSGVSVPRAAVTDLMKAVGFRYFGAYCLKCGDVSDHGFEPCPNCGTIDHCVMLWEDPHTASKRARR